jgi:polyisoprenoid-binding protein YceI
LEFCVLKAAALLLFCSSLWAQQISIQLDPAKSEIHWTLAGNVHTTHGTFRLKQGHVELDPASGAIRGELVADAASGDSGNGSRDKRMNKEILESAQFPEIHFTPEKVEGAVPLDGHTSVRISGAFLIHGGTHKVTVPMDVSISSGTVTGTGKFSIPYVDWGIKDPSNFLFKVDKSVEVEILAIGKIQAK